MITIIHHYIGNDLPLKAGDRFEIVGIDNKSAGRWKWHIIKCRDINSIHINPKSVKVVKSYPLIIKDTSEAKR